MLRVLFLILLGTGVTACENAPSLGEAALAHTVGQDISALTVQTLEGTPQPLTDLTLAHDPRPIVLNIWATWCAPCVVEMPTLDALGRSGEARVVAISTDPSATVVKEFLRQQRWGQGLEIWHDPHGKITRAALSATALPASYVLNPSLTITYAVMGERDWVSPAMLKKLN